MCACSIRRGRLPFFFPPLLLFSHGSRRRRNRLGGAEKAFDQKLEEEVEVGAINDGLKIQHTWHYSAGGWVSRVDEAIDGDDDASHHLEDLEEGDIYGTLKGGAGGGAG